MIGTDLPRRHLLTISVEDFFHATALNPLIPRRHWRRFASRVPQNVERCLGLLAEFDIQATFFVLGWVADEMPQVVARIAEQGHEVACKGYHHRALDGMTPEEFRADLCRAREAIERATGQPVLGYRVAQGRLQDETAWALSILAEEGFVYDSSAAPQARSIAGESWQRLPHRRGGQDAPLLEFPISSLGPDHFPVPVAGGNYFRQLPAALVHRAFASWNRRHEAPFNMYFHIWELDAELPRVSTAGWFTRIRQYRNIKDMEAKLRQLFARHRFGSIAGHITRSGFGAELIPLSPQRRAARGGGTQEPATAAGSPSPPPAANRLPVSIVIPCFNEEDVLPYLANTLEELQEKLGQDYDLTFILVDDASTDQTWAAMGRLFQDWPHCRLLRHAENRGVGATIRTGVQHAETEVVCSMDSDCTYDPQQLEQLIPLLEEDVAVVTASPYHRDGLVRGVPAWRLFLSRHLSRLYRLVFHQRLATYTSCFRVYRRSAVVDVELEHDGYLGVCELLARLDAEGQRIVECPAILEVRVLGQSKMKVLRVILGHARLFSKLACQRWLGGSARPPKRTD